MRIAAQILDSTYGQSAVGVQTHLELASEDGWTTVANAVTNTEGRIDDWPDRNLNRGLYRLVVDSESYFASLGVSTAYPEVIVVFRMLSESGSCQVQVTMCPYSYSTYLGTVKSGKQSALADAEQRSDHCPPAPITWII